MIPFHIRITGTLFSENDKDIVELTKMLADTIEKFKNKLTKRYGNNILLTENTLSVGNNERQRFIEMPVVVPYYPYQPPYYTWSNTTIPNTKKPEDYPLIVS